MNTEKLTDVGVIVGRFQTPIIHDGHKQVIQKVLSRHSRVVVFLGISPHKCTRKDPYDFQIRKSMLEEMYPEIEVDYINDIGDDTLWSKILDKQIKRVIGPNQTATLYGSRDSFLMSYRGKFPTCALIPSKYISASEIRQSIGIKAKKTQDFREGMVFAMESQPTRVIPSLELAILKKVGDSSYEFLMVRKMNETLLRFPGMEMKVESDSFETDLLTLVKEQVGSSVSVSSFSYIGSCKLNVWEYRSQFDKVKTAFFVTNHIVGEPSPEDPEIAELQWVKSTSMSLNNIISIHHPLVKMLKGHGFPII